MKLKIVLPLIAIISIIFYITYFGYENNVNSSRESTIEVFRFDNTERIKFDSTKIDFRELNFNLKNEIPILAIGVIHLETCSGCIIELIEFSDLIDKIADQFISANGIEKIFVLIGQKPLKVSWFVNAHGINETTIFVHEDSNLAETFTQWKGNRKSNQWLFVNRKKEMIVSRIAVLSGITPLTMKEDLLNTAIFSSNLNFD